MTGESIVFISFFLGALKQIQDILIMVEASQNEKILPYHNKNQYKWSTMNNDSDIYIMII